jgi:Protein of unknown function (DUF1553)/Protein of unknown function (DUF1549)/Planctomycete cytochrome C/F5/8 type C domain
MRLARYLLSFSLSASAALAAPVDFNREVRPIISEKCFACHGPDDAARKAKLRLDIRDVALKEREGVRAIVPGKPDDSELMVRILSKDPDEMMPPPKEHHEISPAEIDIFRRWITEGAPYAKHWAFEKPQRPAVPEINDAAQPLRTPIDRFITAELRKKGLGLSPDADRHTVLRRLSLDLIGLPPTPAEVEAFVQDTRPDYYERAVDRLLASPHFGERWARMWMDCGRYADSTGYGSDKMRPFMWPWRDWVINAFNRNLPYDQFTTEQLAGDLLPNATPDQILATTFHRNTMTNIEGGTIDEEYRVAAIKDRVSTTMQVWMGLTAGCAQCHSHKFDPISHRDYYSLFAIFNQTEDSDREDEEPRLPLPTAEEEKRTAELNAQVKVLSEALTSTTPELEAEFHEWEAKMLRPVEWKPLTVSEAKATSDAKLETLPDQSLIVRSGAAERDQYTIGGSSGLKKITAVRIEALPDDSLPSHGPGRAGNGNAVLSELRATIREANPNLPRARFVRVELPGKDRILSLAEVEVFSGGKNIATKGTASQSSIDYGGEPARAIDGNTNGKFEQGKSITHTARSENPWWEVDLGNEYPLDGVIVWNRLEGMSDRIKGARVVLLDALRKEIASRVIEETPVPKTARLFDDTKTVKLANASADFAQPGFEAPLAIDGNEATGWGLAGASGVPHALVAECTPPITLESNAELIITLGQQYGGHHTLGRFRISATDAPAPVRELPPAIRGALALEPSERTPEQRTALLNYYRPLSKYASDVQQKLDTAKAQLAKVKPTRVPILRELPPDKQRKTFILTKGNYLSPGEEVTAATLKEFHPAPEGRIDRLALSKWIMDPENPLTARVAVNRFWSQLFGRGLVESEEDFGTQGTLPSHPELLDWLAIEFRENGWDIKRLLKLIVSSTTYRQSSKVSPELLQQDPLDRLLSRYPRRRLGAEEVRDQALAVSGLLSERLGGPSVYPPQPDGLWKVAFNGASQAEYKTSTGEDRWRRGLYTVWRRTMPNPTMVTFDAPSRETCTIRRVPTNTPLQAFVTLNDPVFVECSQALARRIIKEGGADPDARIRFALQLCLTRPVDEKQIAPLRRLLDEELLQYKQSPEDATKLATQPLGPLPAGIDTAEAAAWTSVANVILNLDGFLARN